MKDDPLAPSSGGTRKEPEVEGQSAAIASAIDLIASVPGFAQAAQDLRRSRVRFRADFVDRGQVSLLGTILLGPEPFDGAGEIGRVSLAATLVHEHWHTRQNPLEKTVSFWGGVFTRTHPMRRVEWPAYRRQAEFLQALATVIPALHDIALQERDAVILSFTAVYGLPGPP